MNAIEVGGKLLMDLTGLPNKLHSYFVGYVKARFVITMLPLVPEVNRPTLLEYLYKGNSVTVRFIRQGTVLGFSATVAHVTFTPIPLLFLEYPQNFESYNLRKDNRVVCLFPVTVVIKGRELSGALSDISKSGGSIVIPINEDQPGLFPIDDVIHFRCPLLFGDPQAQVPGMIKRVSKNGTKVELGLKFNEIKDEPARRISEYIGQTHYFMDG